LGVGGEGESGEGKEESVHKFSRNIFKRRIVTSGDI
jgi:hypothetical protein